MTNEPTTTDAQPNGQSPSTGHQSPEQRAANRANAQHSTGPRTEAGKQRSALNATRHGLTGQTIVLPSDDLDAYQERVRKFFADYQPHGESEKQLVQTLADTAWRLSRIVALENNLLTLGTLEHEDSIDTDDPRVRTALAMAKAYREQSHVIANLGTHEQRLNRVFEKALKQIRELQAQRHSVEKEQLQNAAIIMEMHKDEGLPYDPAKDGFVLSPAEIETCIERNHTLSKARVASFWRR